MNQLFDMYRAALCGNLFVKLLAISIGADMVFGSLRAARERCWNSSVGIDGGIRKAGMVAAAMLMAAMDILLPLDMVGFVSEDIRALLLSGGIVKVGITELFCLLFILYELTSVLKNMLLCGIPIPKLLRQRAAAWLRDMTEETEAEL